MFVDKSGRCDHQQHIQSDLTSPMTEEALEADDPATAVEPLTSASD